MKKLPSSARTIFGEFMAEDEIDADGHQLRKTDGLLGISSRCADLHVMTILLSVISPPGGTKMYWLFDPVTNSSNWLHGGSETLQLLWADLSSSSASIICVPAKSGEMPEAWAPLCVTCSPTPGGP